MRRILIFVVILLMAILNGCSSKTEITDLFESFSAETSENTPYVHHNTLVFNDVILDFDVLLKKNDIDGFFHEVYAVQDNVIFFGYSESARSQNGGKTWHIATVTIGQEKCNSVFFADFCAESGSDQHYISNSNSHSQNRYTVANGFYCDGKIVLTDHVKLIEFDIKTGTAIEFAAHAYNYPTMPGVEIVDFQTISFSKGSQQKIFDTNEGAQASAVFGEMLELRKNKNWKGDSLLSDLFDKVQIVDNQIYIICRVMNWNGETHAVVYLYDFETNGCEYAFHCFMDDFITNNLYVVPMVS